MTDIFTTKKRKQLMAKVRSRDTDIEMIIRKRLWALGYRYRVHYNVFGRPDIVFPKYKLAIFCDGDFWHGRSFKKEKAGYKKFWKKKIASNIKRDKEVNRKLRSDGWRVLRFWKKDILKNPDNCIEKIRTFISDIVKQQ